jgi:hypothetical protein
MLSERRVIDYIPQKRKHVSTKTVMPSVIANYTNPDADENSDQCL